MLKFLKDLGNILPLTKNSFLPAFIMAVGLLTFYAFETIPTPSMLTLHSIFYLSSFATFVMLTYFNRSKPAIFLLNIVLSYILINYWKKTFGSEYVDDFSYINMTIILPINLLILYMLPNFKFFSKENLYTFLAFISEIAVFEKLSQSLSLGINFFIPYSKTYNELSLAIILISGIILLFRVSLYSRILPSYMFFAFIDIMFGIIYSDSPTALSIFYSIAVLTILIGLSYDIYYTTYKDVVTSLESRTSYMIQSQKFPLKYSVAIVSIDDYDRLSKEMKKRDLDAITTMIANKIVELEKEISIYRYDEDEFVLIFKNENKDDSFERVEVIRRAIASSEFFLRRRKPCLKLTISAGVSDKKRSDANSHEVLLRTRKILEKTNKFSQNITTKA